MLAVARCVEGHGQADPSTLEADTRLPQERINVAVLILQHLGAVKLVQTLGRSPYDFTETRATRHTRAWLRENTS